MRANPTRWLWAAHAVLAAPTVLMAPGRRAGWVALAVGAVAGSVGRAAVPLSSGPTGEPLGPGGLSGEAGADRTGSVGSGSGFGSGAGPGPGPGSGAGSGLGHAGGASSEGPGPAAGEGIDPEFVRQWAVLAMFLLLTLVVVFTAWALAANLRYHRGEREKRAAAARDPGAADRAVVDPWFEAGQRADPIDDDAEFEHDEADDESEDEDDPDDVWHEDDTGPGDEDDDDPSDPDRRFGTGPHLGPRLR